MRSPVDNYAIHLPGEIESECRLFECARQGVRGNVPAFPRFPRMSLKWLWTSDMTTPRWRRLPAEALTAEQHAAAQAVRGRPLTDGPIGRHTAAKREADAQASAAFVADDEHTELLVEMIEHRKGNT